MNNVNQFDLFRAIGDHPQPENMPLIGAQLPAQTPAGDLPIWSGLQPPQNPDYFSSGSVDAVSAAPRTAPLPPYTGARLFAF